MHADPKHQTIDREVLDRYLARESAAEEFAAVEVWLAAHPDQAARLVHPVVMSQEMVETDWARIVARVGEFAPEMQTQIRQTRRIGRQSGGHLVGGALGRGVWYTLAASLMGAAVIVAGWKLGSAGRLGRGVTSESAYTTYATTNGQRAAITLPDGNTVALNVASRLEVPTNYGAGNHMVQLPVGEALFTVAHHVGAPFTVVAGATVARVLGTSFVVRHYLTDTVTTVAVEDGKVAVRSTVITAQRLVEIDQRGVTRVRSVDPSRFTFATGVLTLDVTSLSEAIPELDRWYDADIQLGDPVLGRQEIKGKFTAGSLADLAAILELMFDVRVVRDGRVLTLYPIAK